MDESSNKLQPWTIQSQEIAFKTPWFEIIKQDLKTPSGATPTFYIHHTHDSVMCVCATDDGRLLVEKQYRPSIKKVSVDYPAGRLEADDKDVETAMLRELQEETGYSTTSFKRLAVIDKDPGFSTTRMHIFLAQGAMPGNDNPEATESIVSEFIPAEQVFGMIISGEMSCAYCVSATFFAFKELGWLKFKTLQ
jgi:ADP-ribose pyrophosphatase YjhB (NUDIX family)